MAEHVTLILKNDVAELDKVLNLVADLCARHAISADTEYDLKLALDEVVSNVARHAYPAGENHRIYPGRHGEWRRVHCQGRG